MYIDQLITELNEKGESRQNFSSSLWKEHSRDSVYKIKISRDFDTFEPEKNKIISTAELDALKYYLENEEKFYHKITSQFLEVLPVILKEYEVEGSEIISREFIKEHIELIAIKLEEVEGEIFIEFDFAPSWDNEHGLVALAHGDNILGFAEGGYCWFYNIAGEDGYWSVKF